jgi:uncharacterized protein (DUF302 family)
MIRSILLASALVAAPLAASAQDAITFPFAGSFDDASFAIENAIINRGLVIDYTSHVGDMLNRTGEDIEGAQDLYDNAQIFLFCSAAVSRRVMEADPMNIVHCPYGIFIAEREGEVLIGHRDYPDGPMQEVEALLDAIILEATAE